MKEEIEYLTIEEGWVMGTVSTNKVGSECTFQVCTVEEYEKMTDDEALKAFHDLTRIEGILPALESSHAVSYAMKLATTMSSEQSILVNLSGRGDKDIHTVASLEGIEA